MFPLGVIAALVAVALVLQWVVGLVGELVLG
jgi:hypothetical protein